MYILRLGLGEGTSRQLFTVKKNVYKLMKGDLPRVYKYDLVSNCIEVYNPEIDMGPCVRVSMQQYMADFGSKQKLVFQFRNPEVGFWLFIVANNMKDMLAFCETCLMGNSRETLYEYLLRVYPEIIIET